MVTHFGPADGYCSGDSVPAGTFHHWDPRMLMSGALKSCRDQSPQRDLDDPKNLSAIALPKVPEDGPDAGKYVTIDDN